MDFEWDAGKARANLRTHGVDFTDAVTALFDDPAITLADSIREEERFVTVGMDGLGRLLVVVYTWRGDLIRVISARRATPHERRQYEGAK